MNLRLVVTSADFATARALFREYVKTPGVEVCAVGFEEELAALETRYDVILLAEHEGRAIGCGAVRRYGDTRAEMKRLYVDASARGLGAGRALVEGLILHARDLRCRSLLLDTLPSMTAAMALYESLGFRRIPPYSPDNPPEAHCYELSL